METQTMMKFNPAYFIEELSKLSSNPVKLKEEGMSDDLQQRILKSYQIIPRNVVSKFDNPFLKFIEEYTLDNFEVADAEFLEKVIEEDGCYLIGL